MVNRLSRSNEPDRWTRLRSAAYPPYLPVRITSDLSPDKNPSLRVGMFARAAIDARRVAEIRRLAARVGERRQRVEGAIQIREAIDENEIGRDTHTRFRWHAQ